MEMLTTVHPLDQDFDPYKSPHQDLIAEDRITGLIVEGEFRQAADLEREQARVSEAIGEPELALSHLEVALHLRDKAIVLDGERGDADFLDEVIKEKIMDIVEGILICKRSEKPSDDLIHKAHILNSSLSMSAGRLDVETLIDDTDPHIKKLVAVTQAVYLYGGNSNGFLRTVSGELALNAQHINGKGAGGNHNFRYSSMLISPNQAVAVRNGKRRQLVANDDGKTRYWNDTDENRESLTSRSIELVGELS